MQNIYKYIRYFQLSSCQRGYTFLGSFVNSFSKLHEDFLENSPEESEFTHSPWEIPFDRPYINKYYIIIKYFAKYFKVKIMYRDILKEDASETKEAFWVIGEKTRVEIFKHIVSHYFMGQFYYEKSSLDTYFSLPNVKRQKLGNAKNYASKMVNNMLRVICDFIKEILADDISYDLKLQNIIKERFSLDYKKYDKGGKGYYNAISKKFHHKRMML